MQKDGAERIKRETSRSSIWTAKITPITFALSLASGALAQTVITHTGIILSLVLLGLLVVTAVIFDGVGVAITSCDRARVKKLLQSHAKRAKIAMRMMRNAEKVNNVCADVIGDICGVLSGACGAAIAAGLSVRSGAGAGWLPTLTSAAVAALTVGGKAFLKGKAVKNADKYIAAAATLLSYIYTPRTKKDKNR